MMRLFFVYAFWCIFVSIFIMFAVLLCYDLSYRIYFIFCFFIKYLVLFVIFTIFLIKDHLLWSRLFVCSLDFEFFDLQSKKVFFGWLNFNLIHLEFIAFCIQIFRTCYIVGYFFILSIQNCIRFVVFRFRLLFFVSVFYENLYYFVYFFCCRFKLFYVLRTALIVSIWRFFLWWRAFYFLVTRLDLNYILAALFDEKAIAGQVRGFFLFPVKNEYIFYLDFLRPFFFSSFYFIKEAWFLRALNFIYKYIFFFFFSFFSSHRWINVYHFYFYFAKEDSFPIIFWVKYCLVCFLQGLGRVSSFFRQFLLVCLLNFWHLFLVCYWISWNLLWIVAYILYKIRFLLLLASIISFFGLSFLSDFLVWILELVTIFSEGAWGTVEHALLPVYVSNAFFFDFCLWPLRYDISCAMPKWKWLGTNDKDIRRRLVYTWHYMNQYDYALMSLKRIGELKTDDDEPIEDWQKMLVWNESFNWTPKARNLEDDNVLWSEGIRLQEIELSLFFLKRSGRLLFEIDFPRLFRAATYDNRVIKRFYRHWSLWYHIKKWFLSTKFSRLSKLKKKWHRTGILWRFTVCKIKSFVLHLVTNDFYRVLLWFYRIRFYFFVSLFDFMCCFSVNYVIRYVLASKLISIIVVGYFGFYIFWNSYPLWDVWILQFIDFGNWCFLYELSSKFFGTFKVEFEFLTTVHFFFWFYIVYYFSLYGLSEEVFFGLCEQRPTLGSVLKAFFTCRDYVKSLIDIFYLDYTSFVHRRYTYVAYNISGLRKRLADPKKRRIKFYPTKRSSMARYLVLPNSIISGLFGNAFGGDSQSKFYWKFRRHLFTFKWIYRYQKLFRTVDFLVVLVWIWILFCSIFFVGFRKFFVHKLIQDYNGFFYWLKVRMQPVSELVRLFGKLDRQFIRDQLQAIIWDTDIESSAWMYDFKAEIDWTKSENMKEFYKASLHEILKRPTSFVWRLRRLSKDYIRNWEKIEFYFFDESTENYFKTWLNHSNWLNIVVFELMLISNNKDFYGLNLNSLDDEEDFNNNFEYVADFANILNSLANKIFYFYFNIDKHLFNLGLPEWVWHKGDFLYYTMLEPYSEQFTTVSFEDTVVNIIGPWILWACFFPGWFLFFFRKKLSKKGWRGIKWASVFWRMVLLYQFDWYAEGVHFLMRAYFHSYSFFLWRGKFTGKSFNVMRKRKLKWRKRFIWHYLSTCYSDFVLMGSHVHQSRWKFLVFLRYKSVSLWQSFAWFSNVWNFLFIFFIIFVFILVRHNLRRYRTFREELSIIGSFKEFVYHTFYLEMYFSQKMMLRRFIKNNKLWF